MRKVYFRQIRPYANKTTAYFVYDEENINLALNKIEMVNLENQLREMFPSACLDYQDLVDNCYKTAILSFANIEDESFFQLIMDEGIDIDNLYIYRRTCNERT